MTEENKNIDAPPPHKNPRAFFSKSKNVWFIACVLLITTLVIGFQNCSRDYGGNITHTTNPCGENRICKETFRLEKGDRIETDPTDILFIIDNSGSMEEEQQKISEKFDAFLDQLANVDFQIGIITTDEHHGGFLKGGNLINFDSNTRFLTPSTQNLKNLFKTKVRVGIGGSATEIPFVCATLAIEERVDHNKGFFRDNANLVLVILTDEDERSATGKDNFFNKFYETWPKKQIVVHGIAVPSGEECPTHGFYAGEDRSTIIFEAASQTGGIEGNVCDDDYGPILSDIGRSIVTNKLTLSHKPIIDSMKITIQINGENIELSPEDYTVNENVVIVSKFLAPDTELTVEYKHK